MRMFIFVIVLKKNVWKASVNDLQIRANFYSQAKIFFFFQISKVHILMCVYIRKSNSTITRTEMNITFSMQQFSISNFIITDKSSFIDSENIYYYIHSVLCM